MPPPRSWVPQFRGQSQLGTAGAAVVGGELVGDEVVGVGVAGAEVVGAKDEIVWHRA